MKHTHQELERTGPDDLDHGWLNADLEREDLLGEKAILAIDEIKRLAELRAAQYRTSLNAASTNIAGGRRLQADLGSTYLLRGDAARAVIERMGHVEVRQAVIIDLTRDRLDELARTGGTLLCVAAN